MGYCYCVGKVSSPKQVCDGCIRANKIIVGCGQGLKPCGDTTTINLNTYNNNVSAAVYSLAPNSYSLFDFSAVTLTAAGVLSVTTGNNYTPHGLHEIKYSVTKGKNKDFESIWLCFDSPCTGGCTTCNVCTGECYGVPADGSATAACGEVDKTYNAATGLNTGSCDGTTTWSAVFPAALAGVISNAGLITYDITGFAVPGQIYRITWKAICSLYGMQVSGFLDVTIDDLCVGVVCGDDQDCDKCTGECNDKESDMGAQGFAIGSQSSVTVTIT